MTGFRVARGGAQDVYSVQPDLTTLGKILGGGLPAAAFGGRADIMASLAPDGPVYQAGTLSGNPLAMAAGLATLNELSRPDFMPGWQQKPSDWSSASPTSAERHGIELQTVSLGGMFGFVFASEGPIRSFAQVTGADIDAFRRFFHGMLDNGVYLAPSAYEAGFVSAEHGDAEIEQTLAAADSVFATRCAH